MTITTSLDCRFLLDFAGRHRRDAGVHGETAGALQGAEEAAPALRFSDADQSEGILQHAAIAHRRPRAGRVKVHDMRRHSRTGSLSLSLLV